MDDTSEKKEANAPFAKEQRLNDAKQAMAEYEAAAVATRAKTERLRALRLARDAATPSAPAKKRKAAAGKKGKAGGAQASGNLADWLDDQAKQGRRG
jgi:hypothetical protein